MHFVSIVTNVECLQICQSYAMENLSKWCVTAPEILPTKLEA